MTIPIPHPQYTRLSILNQEVELLREQILPHDTGHIYTAISVLENQISQIKETINYETE